DINANQNNRLAPVSPLDDRLAARVRIVTPHPCEEHAVAGPGEVERDMVPTDGRRRTLGRRAIEWKVSDPPLFGQDVDEELRPSPAEKSGRSAILHSSGRT